MISVAAPRFAERAHDRGLQLIPVANEGEPSLPLTVRRLHHAGQADRGEIRRELGEDLPTGLRDGQLGEALALPELRGRDRGGAGLEWMRQAKPLGDAGGDRHRPVDPGGDQPVDALGRREPFDARLVLGRDDRPPVGVAETGRRGIAVERDHEQPPLARGGQQAELGRSRP